MNLLLEAYERAQTDRVTKESAVKLIVFFLDTIKLHDYLINEIFEFIGLFKSLRENQKSDKQSQEWALQDLKDTIKFAFDNKLTPIKVKNPQDIERAIYSVIKNDSSIFKAKIPQSLKYLVEKFANSLDIENANIDYLLNNAKDLKATNRFRLNQNYPIFERYNAAKKKTVLDSANPAVQNLAAIKIQERFKKFNEKKKGTGEAELKFAIFNHMGNVSKFFTYVPTAIEVNEIIPLMTHENGKRLLSANEISKDNQEKINGIGLIRTQKINETKFRQVAPSHMGTSELDLINAIDKQIGSCKELAETLFLILKNDPILIKYKENIELLGFCTGKDYEKDDHLMVGIFDFFGENILIVDPWIKHINLKATPGYRNNEVKANERDRGFMGWQDAYLKFINAHEDGKYIRFNNRHRLAIMGASPYLIKEKYNAPIIEKIRTKGLLPPLI
jgi:hypothetical protein